MPLSDVRAWRKTGAGQARPRQTMVEQSNDDRSVGARNLRVDNGFARNHRRSFSRQAANQARRPFRLCAGVYRRRPPMTVSA
jgi:hypothetical protein